MSETTWCAVDEYFAKTLLAPDEALEAALAANAAAGLPGIDVSPLQGKLLSLLAKMCGAKRVLEIGTLGGYSTIWLAQALPADGRVVTLELDPKHAAVARTNFERAGLSGKIELRQGPAVDSLAQLVAEGVPPFDLVFLDADKPSNPLYLEAALKLSRPGTVILGDNVVREGAVADPSSCDERVQGSRRLLEMMGADPRLEATALQTVGSKGYDGFALAILR